MMDDMFFRMAQLKQEGFCCTQIMLILALEAQGKTNEDLIRASGGLCFGVGMSGEICGCLSGGACLISLCAGKGSPSEEADHRLPLMLNDLIDWFRNTIGDSYGGIRCDDILTRSPDKSACGPIAITTYGRVLEILLENGFDPQTGRND